MALKGKHTGRELPAELKTISDDWYEFLAMVYDRQAMDAEQERQLRGAFYAGYLSAFVKLSVIESPDVDEVDAVKYLEERRDECNQFLIKDIEANAARKGVILPADWKTGRHSH